MQLHEQKSEKTPISSQEESKGGLIYAHLVYFQNSIDPGHIAVMTTGRPYDLENPIGYWSWAGDGMGDEEKSRRQKYQDDCEKYIKPNAVPIAICLGPISQAQHQSIVEEIKRSQGFSERSGQTFDESGFGLTNNCAHVGKKILGKIFPEDKETFDSFKIVTPGQLAEKIYQFAQNKSEQSGWGEDLALPGTRAYADAFKNRDEYELDDLRYRWQVAGQLYDDKLFRQRNLLVAGFSLSLTLSPVVTSECLGGNMPDISLPHLPNTAAWALIGIAVTAIAVIALQAMTNKAKKDNPYTEENFQKQTYHELAYDVETPEDMEDSEADYRRY